MDALSILFKHTALFHSLMLLHYRIILVLLLLQNGWAQNCMIITNSWDLVARQTSNSPEKILVISIQLKIGQNNQSFHFLTVMKFLSHYSNLRVLFVLLQR